jgi:hypothetical protein
MAYEQKPIFTVQLGSGRLPVFSGYWRAFDGHLSARNSQTGHTLIETCDLIDLAEPALN